MMFDSLFDRWTIAITSSIPRRTVLGGVLAGVATAIVGNRTAQAAPPAKVTICHRTGNRNDRFKLISISESALAAHLRHGDFVAYACDEGWSCEDCTDCDLLPLFCDSENVCPTGAHDFCPGGPFDAASSNQAKAACEACFGVGACVDNDLDCSGAGWLQNFEPASEPPIGTPVFGYEIGMCVPADPQPAGRVFYGTASDPTWDYGYWGTETCPE